MNWIEQLRQHIEGGLTTGLNPVREGSIHNAQTEANALEAKMRLWDEINSLYQEQAPHPPQLTIVNSQLRPLR